MLPRAILALALSALLTGCASTATLPEQSTLAEGSNAPERAMDWTPGNWWAYHATIEGTEFDIAIILHEVRPDGFRLGTNLTSGFFGLPWSGNVTLDHNPVIGAEEWKLFDPPLHDGQEWSYAMLGHDAKTKVRTASIALPDGTSTAGHELESTSYGQLFARYDHADVVGWFTHLQLIEPTDGHTVLEAELTAFGPDWDSAYYVERVVRELRIEYPALPDVASISIPAGYATLRANLVVQSTTGLLSGILRDEDGRTLASARVLARGAETDRASVRAEDGARWTLDHKGLSTGVIYLEITGVALAGPLAEAQSTRPAYPQLGQEISVPFPLASGS